MFKEISYDLKVKEIHQSTIKDLTPQQQEQYELFSKFMQLYKQEQEEISDVFRKCWSF